MTAFANMLGGDLFLGVVDQQGVATRITPLAVQNLDQEIQRLTSILQLWESGS